MSEDDVDRLSRAFAALSDPVRRDIVARLTVGDATVNDLAAPYDISLQAVSKHLKVLEGAGLVTRRREAQRRPVHLESEALAAMTGWIEQHQQRAEERQRHGRADEGRPVGGAAPGALLVGGHGPGAGGAPAPARRAGRWAPRRRLPPRGTRRTRRRRGRRGRLAHRSPWSIDRTGRW